MKKILCVIFSLLILVSTFTTTASAVTHTQIITPEYNEDTVVAISFKGFKGAHYECVYTGKPIKPEVVVTKVDGSVAKPSEYTITYDDNCHELGVHYVTVVYLKSDYKIMLDYWVVPGKTTKVDMTAKNGVVTLSWAPVKGAKAYRVLEYNASKGMYVEIPWEDGSYAANKTSRTFNNLKAGKTYNMAIMALETVDHMPTEQIKTFKFTVPASGEGSLNIVPGVKVTTTKPSTTHTVTETTTFVELTTESTTETTTESTSVVETSTKAETSDTNNTTTVGASKTETPNSKIVIATITAIALIGIVATVVIVSKKKK